jgi:hypothetical protein
MKIQYRLKECLLFVKDCGGHWGARERKGRSLDGHGRGVWKLVLVLKCKTKRPSELLYMTYLTYLLAARSLSPWSGLADLFGTIFARSSLLSSGWPKRSFTTLSSIRAWRYPFQEHSWSPKLSCGQSRRDRGLGRGDASIVGTLPTRKRQTSIRPSR